jgi:RHS repeat-associated protein
MSEVAGTTGQASLTLPIGNYRFRADKNGTQFWSAAENNCEIPNCTTASVTTTIPVVVTVKNTDNLPEAGLNVYAFDGSTYTNYSGKTDAGGQVTLTLPQGSYRFRADKNGTQFWSAAENDCEIPGCVSAAIETTIPVTITVLDSGGAPQAGLPVYAFDGTAYTNYSATTDAEGKAVMTLPQGSYRFRADEEGVQYWSGETNHCSVPGCLAAAITVPGGATSLVTKTITYTYDGLNRLIAADYDSGEYFHYTYDNVGNRQTEEKKPTPDGLIESTSYTYDDANRMLSDGGVTCTWDNNGNLLNDGTNTYTYNHSNRLTMVQGPSSIVSFTYNGLGDRLSETINGVTTIFTLDLNTGLTQVLADGTHAYLYGLGRIAQVSGSESVYFLGDALGSVRQLADGQGIVILARAYEPYGSVLSTVGEDATKYGFTGEWQENGLVFLRARYYFPYIGKFTSQDTWSGDSSKSLSINRWLYGFNNPIQYVDHDGSRPIIDRTYEGEVPPPEIFTYDETVPPANIQFIGTELSADRISWQECIKTGFGIACYHHPKMKGDSGWQYFHGNTGLCGQISLAAILLGALDENINIHDMFQKYKYYMAEYDPDPNYTQPNHLARFINLAYGDILHAWYEDEGSKWLKTYDWLKSGEKDRFDLAKERVINLLSNEWFGQNTYVMAMIRIDPTKQGKGRLSWGVPYDVYGHERKIFGDKWVNNEEPPDSCRHWVVITGVSVEWDNPWGGTWDNPWQWIRVFNPFRGISEYYWWRDFKDSWTGQMIRVDRADAAETCSIYGDGQCTTPVIAGMYNTIHNTSHRRNVITP